MNSVLIRVPSGFIGQNLSPYLQEKDIVVAKAGDALHLPLTTERLQKLTESYVVSNEKIKKALNIQEMPVSSREGLFKTINSFN